VNLTQSDGFYPVRRRPLQAVLRWCTPRPGSSRQVRTTLILILLLLATWSSLVSSRGLGWALLPWCVFAFVWVWTITIALFSHLYPLRHAHDFMTATEPSRLLPGACCLLLWLLRWLLPPAYVALLLFAVLTDRRFAFMLLVATVSVFSSRRLLRG